MTCMTEADKPVTTSSGRFMREPTKKPADHSHQAARSRKLVKMTNGQLEVRAWRSPCQRLTSKPACFGASAMEISGLRNPKLCWRHAWMVSCNLTLWRSLKRQGKLHLRKRKGGSSRRTRAKKDISFHCCFQSFDIMIPHDTVISFIHADPTWGENAEAHEEPAVADHQPQAAEGWTPHDMVHGTVYPAHDVRQPGSGWCEFSTSTWMNMERSMWKKGRWLEDVFISFSCWLSNLPLSAHLIAPNLTAVLIPRGHKPVLAFSLPWQLHSQTQKRRSKRWLQRSMDLTLVTQFGFTWDKSSTTFRNYRRGWFGAWEQWRTVIQSLTSCTWDISNTRITSSASATLWWQNFSKTFVPALVALSIQVLFGQALQADPEAAWRLCRRQGCRMVGWPLPPAAVNRDQVPVAGGLVYQPGQELELDH